MRRGVGYAFLFFWVAAAGGAQLFALGCVPRASSILGQLARACVPDLMTLVLVAAVGRLARRDVVKIALVAATARAAFTVAPPFAIVAGSVVVAMIADTVRRFAELDRASLRFCAAGAGALAFSLWLLFVDFVRADEARTTDTLGFGQVTAADIVLPFATAFTTALIGLALWPVLQRLPGLGRLERRAF